MQPFPRGAGAEETEGFYTDDEELRGQGAMARDRWDQASMNGTP